MRVGNRETIDRLLDHQHAGLRSAYAVFVRSMRSPAMRRLLVEYAKQHDVDGVTALIGRGMAPFVGLLNATRKGSGQFELDQVKQHLGSLKKAIRKVGLTLSDDDLSFDAGDPDAASLMDNYQLDFLQDFSTKQRRATRAALVSSLKQGENPDVAARKISESIGLTETQWNAVNNYRNSLEQGSSDALSRSLRDARFDSTISSAIDRGDVLDADQIDRMVTSYTDRMVDYRAKTIALTESHRMVSMGRNQAWHQLVDESGIDEGNITRTWHATNDNRTRDTHEEMDGQEVTGFEPFESSSGALLLYPGDPTAPAEETIRCRCVETYAVNTD